MKCINFKVKTKKKTKYFYCNQKKENIQLNDCSTCTYKQYKQPKKKMATLKNKSNRLAKLERNRFSLFTNDFSKCYLCSSTYKITKHEIFCGKNRSNSMKYGLVLPLCLSCHEKYQEDKSFNETWHIKGREAFEENYPDLDFLSIFRRNYK